MVTLKSKRIETKIEISASECGITMTEMVSCFCDGFGKLGDFRKENQLDTLSRLRGNPSHCLAESAESSFFLTLGIQRAKTIVCSQKIQP